MRQQVHDQSVHFRANSAIVAALSAKATRQGMSLSELLRAAARREVREAA